MYFSSNFNIQLKYILFNSNIFYVNIVRNCIKIFGTSILMEEVFKIFLLFSFMNVSAVP